jgi:hypothetical protein
MRLEGAVRVGECGAFVVESVNSVNEDSSLKTVYVESLSESEISNLCPGCESHEELFEHMLKCHLQTTTESRLEQLNLLLSSLAKLNTPQPIIDAIQHGFQAWLHSTTKPRAPTFGSLGGKDILLTTAFHEKYYNIRWYQFCLGRVSKYWTSADQGYRTTGTPQIDPEYWTSSLIGFLWNFTKQMWANWNQIVHGKTAEDQASRHLTQLKDDIRQQYALYASLPGYVLQRHDYLFTQWSLDMTKIIAFL